MNFLSMDYFLTVAGAKSFTKAAEQLHITQQTLSAHISSIEQELGCQLFIRHVPLKLTYAGEAFFQYASSFQQNYYAMKRTFCDITNNQQGVLRIGIAYTRGRAIMPELISAFQREYPNIEICLAESLNETLHKFVLDGDVDLAIAGFPESLPGVELHNFYREEIVLLIAEDLLSNFPVADEDGLKSEISAGNLYALRECPFVLGNPDDITGRIGRGIIKRSGFQPITKAQSDNVETLLSLCVRGVGGCFCPENLVHTALSSEQLSKLRVFHFSNDTKYQIRFGYLKRPYQWSAIYEFVRIACQQYN